MKPRTLTAVSVLVLALWLSGGCGLLGVGRNHRAAVEHYVTALSLQAEDLDELAVAELQEAARLDTEFALAHSMLGDIYRLGGQNEEAAEAYEKAVRLDPWAFGDHLHLGQVYHVLKRFYDAIKVLKKAHTLRPDHADTNYSLGLSYFETEDYELAQLYTAKANQLNPDNEVILSSLGHIHFKKGDYYKAITSYKQALELDGNQPDIMIKLGAIYTNMKRFAPAKLILNQAIQIAPDQVDPHIALAYCHLIEGQWPQALERYQIAIEIDSSSYKAYSGLGVTYMMLYLKNPGNKQSAFEALQAWHYSLELEADQPRIKKLVEKYSRQFTPSQAQGFDIPAVSQDTPN
ncbi:MAG: tetratricopeptide repeat protein [Planctomycetes bacterium]|nr:tetratricopeptide repeat protein [Planctomycetota bacterium]